MREGPCFTVFPALKHHLVQYRGSTNNEHLGFLDLFDVWSIITYVPNTNSSIAPCHYGENFSHLKWYPLSLPSTPHVSEVLVAQTRWLVLLGKRGARTVDANNEMCVTCLGENKFPWSMFRTQTVTPPPPPREPALWQHSPCVTFWKSTSPWTFLATSPPVTFGFALWNVLSCHLAGRGQVLGKSLAFPVGLSQGLGAYRPGRWRRPSTGFPFIPPHPNIPPPLGPLIHVCKGRNRNLTKRLFLWGSLMAE